MATRASAVEVHLVMTVEELLTVTNALRRSAECAFGEESSTLNKVADDIDSQRYSEIDTDGNPLQPGALYAERFTDANGDGCHWYGRLVWFGGDHRFYDADTGDEADIDADDLTKQGGCFNATFAELTA